KRPIDVADVIAWKAVGSTVLSNDGQGFGYRSQRRGGEGEVVIKRVRADKEMRFPIGEQPQAADGGGGGGRGGGAGAPSVLALSGGGQWGAGLSHATHHRGVGAERA